MAGFNTKESKKSNKTRGVKLTYEFDPVSRVFIFQSLHYLRVKIFNKCIFSFSLQNTFAIIVGEVTMKKICFYVMAVMIAIIHSV